MKRIYPLTLCFIAITTLGFSQTELQPAAMVKLTKTEAIYVKDVKRELEQQFRAQFQQQTGRLPTAAELAKAIQNVSANDRKAFLDTMVNEQLVLQAAERDKVIVSDAEINEALKQMREEMTQRLGKTPTDAEFADTVQKNYGMDLPQFRKYIRKQLTLRRYLLFKKEALLKSAQTPTDADIQKAYDLHKSSMVRPDTVQLSMIWIPFGADAASKNAAKTKADQIKREIGSDSSRFDEAVVKGLTPNAGYRAVQGQYFPRRPDAEQALGESFLSTAFSLKQGQVSGVIEGARAYHIIKVTGSYPQKTLSLDDVVQLGTKVTVREYIRQVLMQERQQAVFIQAMDELMTELRRGNPFELHPERLTF